MAKKTKSFRFHESTLQILEELVAYYQKNDTLGKKVYANDVVESLIIKELDRLVNSDK